ncbi:MAG: GNAT family N-acetyltransferase [Polyangiaceae bacterium]
MTCQAAAGGAATREIDAPARILEYPRMLIRPAQLIDASGIWQVLEPTIRAGETYALPQEMTQQDALAYWFSPGNQVFVAEQAGTLVGTYALRANQAGGGSHVANAAFFVAPAATGRGIAQAMCEHALEKARADGFTAMQFNFVVSSNERAVGLWKRLGFQIVGKLPKAFRHPSLGLVDALVLHREL